MSTWRATATPRDLAAAAVAGRIHLTDPERRRVWIWLGNLYREQAARRRVAETLTGVPR